MRPAYDWLRIVKKAWSFRFSAIAFLFASAELILPLFVDEVPRHIFALLSIAAMAGSMWARLIHQKDYYQ